MKLAASLLRNASGQPCPWGPERADQLGAHRPLELRHHRCRGRSRADAVHADAVVDHCECALIRVEDHQLLGQHVAVGDLIRWSYHASAVS
jgi:hypothetical protein